MPGWLPDYMGGTQPIPEPSKSNITKYNADTNVYFKIYVVLQYFIMLGGASLYMMHFKEISMFYKTVFFLLILITMLICGAIFENKRWVVYAEYARLVLVMICLNSFYYFWHLSWFNFTIIVSSVAFAACVIYFTWSYFTGKQKQALQSVSE